MPKNHPQISVVLTTYNRANTVPRAIESILNQTFKDFELIIVDDGSIDNTQIVLGHYAQKDNRIKTIMQENGGLSSSRNYGVQHAKGKYITFMDDDDVSHPQRLEKQFRYLMQNPDKAACICLKNVNTDIADTTEVNRNNLLNRQSKKSVGYSIDFPPFILNATTLIKKHIFEECGGFDEFFIVMEDYDFTLRFFKNFSAGLVKENLYSYTLTSMEHIKLTHRYRFFHHIYIVMAHIKNDVYFYESKKSLLPKFSIDTALRYLPKVSTIGRKQLFFKFCNVSKRKTGELGQSSVGDHILFLYVIKRFGLMRSFFLFYKMKLKYGKYYRRLGDKQAEKILWKTSYFSLLPNDYKKYLSHINRDFKNRYADKSIR